MTDAPWTRAEQINYAVWNRKDGPPEYNAVWDALHKYARATDCPLGTSVLDHFNAAFARHLSASMSVD